MQTETIENVMKQVLDAQLRLCLDNTRDDRVTLPLARTTIEGIVEWMEEEQIPPEEIEEMEGELKEHAYQIYKEYFSRAKYEDDEEFEREARALFKRGYQADFLK